MKSFSLLLLLLCACGKVVSGVDAAGDDAPPIDAGATPALTSILPTSGVVTTRITLAGTDFGASQGTGTVDVGGAPATITTWSDTSIVADVPLSLFPGDADVTVTTGGGTSGPQTFRVILRPMVYVNNDANDATSGFDTVTSMTFDPTTGAVAQLGTPISLGVVSPSFGGCSTSAVVNERTRRLFATGSTALAVFDIDPVTGALTAVAGSPFSTGAGTTQDYGIAVNDAGTRVFVADFAGHVAVFDIGGTGVPTPVAGSPFATSGGTDTPVLNAGATSLYVNSESNFFDAFSVSSAGALTLMAGSPFSTGAFSFAAALRPAHNQLDVTLDTPAFSVWNLDATTGAPTAAPGSPFAVTVASGTFHYPAFTHDGNRVYVEANGSGAITGFTLDAAGAPTPIAGSPWDFSASVASISCVSLSRDEGFLVGLGEGSNRVGVFAVGGNAALTQVAGSPFVTSTPNESASGMAITF